MTQTPQHAKPNAADGPWIATVTAAIGGPVVVSGGVLHDLRDRPGLIAPERRGLVLWHDAGDTREVLALLALPEGQGTGSALLRAALTDAAARGLGRAILDTTDDNTHAIAFYRRHGFELMETVRGGMARVLALKGLDPETPVIGAHGAPIRDILRFQRKIA